MVPFQQYSFSVLTAILKRQPSSPARTTFAWQLAVGPALARVTSVVLEDGILTVQSTDPRWSGEIKRARGVVLTRLQQLLGTESVTSLRVKQR